MKQNYLLGIIIAIPIICCTLALVILRKDGEFEREAYEFLGNSLSIGMTTDEVSATFEKIGPYEVLPYPPGSCKINGIDYDRKDIRVYGKWKLPPYPIYVSLCFDNTGKLIFHSNPTSNY